MQNLFTKKQIQLETGNVMSLQVTRPICLRILTGTVWVTVEGKCTDYWLSRGDDLDLPRGGLLVIEAVSATPSMLQIVYGRKPWLSRAAAAMNRFLAGCRNHRRVVANVPDTYGQ